MRMEPGPERDQCPYPAPDRDFPVVGRENTGDDAQERGFAAAVASDETKAFAAFEVEGDVLEGPEFVATETVAGGMRDET